MILRLLFLFASLVFPPRGQAAANVPLGLVAVQQRADFVIQRPVDTGQPRRDVFVHRAFADAELCRCGTDGAVVFHNISGQLAGTLLDASSQDLHSLCAAPPRAYSASCI